MEHLTPEERIEGFKRFYAMSNDRGPLVGFFWDSYYPWYRYEAGRAVATGPLRPEQLDPACFLPDYERLYRQHEEAGGDFIWTGAAFWGVPWMEAICGCPIIVDQETGSARSSPPAVVSLPPNLDGNPWVSSAVDYLRVLAEASAGRYPLGTTLMRGLSDTLAGLYGSPDFVFRLTDEPDRMRLELDRITDLWISFGQAQLEAIPDFCGGVGSYFYNMWMPGRGCFLQEDASALLSPVLFERLVLPGIKTIAAAFDTTIIHLHPSSYIPVDPLLETDLTAIELHIDLGGPSAEDLLPIYSKIQSRKPLVIWGDLTDRDVEVLADRVDPASLAVQPVVEDRKRADWIWRTLKG